MLEPFLIRFNANAPVKPTINCPSREKKGPFQVVPKGRPEIRISQRFNIIIKTEESISRLNEIFVCQTIEDTGSNGI